MNKAPGYEITGPALSSDRVSNSSLMSAGGICICSRGTCGGGQPGSLHSGGGARRGRQQHRARPPGAWLPRLPLRRHLHTSNVVMVFEGCSIERAAIRHRSKPGDCAPPHPCPWHLALRRRSKQAGADSNPFGGGPTGTHRQASQGLQQSSKASTVRTPNFASSLWPVLLQTGNRFRAFEA